jgi:uncharacterized glyoxalase superfamily protein PhnB
MADSDRPTIIPRLITPDVAGLVAFLKSVFGATGEVVEGRPVELAIGNSLIMVSDGGGQRAAMPGMFYVYVPDADRAYAAALAAGATSVEAPATMPWGDRRAIVSDRSDNVWQIATS